MKKLQHKVSSWLGRKSVNTPSNDAITNMYPEDAATSREIARQMASGGEDDIDAGHASSATTTSAAASSLQNRHCNRTDKSLEAQYNSISSSNSSSSSNSYSYNRPTVLAHPSLVNPPAGDFNFGIPLQSIELDVSSPHAQVSSSSVLTAPSRVVGTLEQPTFLGDNRFMQMMQDRINPHRNPSDNSVLITNNRIIEQNSRATDMLRVSDGLLLMARERLIQVHRELNPGSSSPRISENNSIPDNTSMRLLNLLRRINDLQARFSPEIQGGVPGSIVQILPTFPYAPRDHDTNDENIQCIICMCEFEVEVEVRALPCLHIFHKDCIDQWLCTSDACPLCKHSVTATGQLS